MFSSPSDSRNGDVDGDGGGHTGRRVCPLREDWGKATLTPGAGYRRFLRFRFAYALAQDAHRKSGKGTSVWLSLRRD